jgi:hypothetical protein
MRERGVGEDDVLVTVDSGERFAAPWGRVGFRKRLRATGGRPRRELLAHVERHDDAWLVLTVIVTAARGRGA